MRDGDRLVTLDSGALDRQIAALKAQAETAKRQLSLVRQDATGFAGATQSATAGRPVLASLEQRTSELEQEAQWLLSRIASAEAELAGARCARRYRAGWWRWTCAAPMPRRARHHPAADCHQ